MDGEPGQQLTHDASFGIIPLRKKDGLWEVFVIQHTVGHWGFPKGHADAHEDAKQTAQRELTEETGLRVKEYLSLEPFCETFNCRCQSRSCENYGKFVCKKVTYFAAYVEGENSLCPREIVQGTWILLSQVHTKIPFPGTREMIEALKKSLK